VRLARLRGGELLALAGVALVVVSLFERWYEAPSADLGAWDTFGPTVVLLLLAAAAALALVVSTLLERSVAVPVAVAVWCLPLGSAGLIAALVRVFERPQHATRVCIGAWLALAGTVAILAGAWLVLRDERPSRYKPASPAPRPRPR
jgi:drug/metabolite transporter (DMT)-like permease